MSIISLVRVMHLICQAAQLHDGDGVLFLMESHNLHQSFASAEAAIIATFARGRVTAQFPVVGILIK